MLGFCHVLTPCAALPGRFRDSAATPCIPRPTAKLRHLQPEQIQDPPDRMVDQIVDGLWIVVERRHRRRDDRAHSAQGQHIFQVDVVQRCFPDQQNKAAPLLERDIGRARDQRVGGAKRMADSVFMLHGATTMPSWRKEPLAIVAAWSSRA